MTSPCTTDRNARETPRPGLLACASVHPTRYVEPMAANGARGPKPYRQRQTSTAFVRVPHAEWAAVKHGAKREFRAGSGQHSALWNVTTPSPAVAHSMNGRGDYDSVLMVLENVWREPLGAISAESLTAEGFATFAEFRRAWVVREKRWFPPLRITTVYRVRPWTDDDTARMGQVLLGHLYGDFLPRRRTAEVASLA